jgi:hypothetical protein
METTLSYQSPLGSFMKLVLFVCAAFIFISVTAHAYERHGFAVDAILHCWSKGGSVKVMHNPQTGRDAHICRTDGNKFGVVIQEDNTVITSFVKDKMQRLDQVINYLKNRGYR